MKIVKCLKCGRYIYKADRCFYCGNDEQFNEIEATQIHENVEKECERLEEMIKNNQFNEALSLSYTIIEWMPRSSMVYWLRLLAKKECTSTAELIEKGFDCENDADFYNAIKFATEAEREIYLDVKKMVLNIRKSFKEEIQKYEHVCKRETNILHICCNMRNEMETQKQKLFSLWSELEKIEYDLRAQELDCHLVEKEYMKSIEAAVSITTSIKAEVYRMEECDDEEFYKYRMKIGDALQQAEVAKNTLDNMRKQHPWAVTYEELVKKRDRQVELIEKEENSLKVYETGIQRTLDEIATIEINHRKALQAVENYDFSEIKQLLGNQTVEKILETNRIKTEDILEKKTDMRF